MTDQTSLLPPEWPETLDGESSVFVERLYLETAGQLGNIVPVFVCVTDDTGAFAGLALQLTKRTEFGVPVYTLTGLKNGQVPRSGLATRGDFMPLLPELVEKLNAYPCDMIEIGPFVEHDRGSKALLDAIKQALPGKLSIKDGSDCIVTDVTNQEDYKKALSANARRNLTKIQNRMINTEGYASRLYTGADVIEGFDAFLSIDRKSWKATDKGGEAIANHPEIQSHFKAVIAKLAQTDDIVINVQYLKGIPVAATLGIIRKGWGYGFKSSYLATEEYRQLSLGMVSIFDLVGHMMGRNDVNKVSLLSHHGYAVRLATGTQQVHLATLWRPTWRTRAVRWGKALRGLKPRRPKT